MNPDGRNFFFSGEIFLLTATDIELNTSTYFERIVMKAQHYENRISNGIEEVLKLVCSLIIAATPVYAIWGLATFPAVPLV